jgi:hypothetical protein
VVDEEDEEGIPGGYSAAFAKLHNAAFVEPEVLPNVPDASRFLAEYIGRYSQVVHTLSKVIRHDILKICEKEYANDLASDCVQDKLNSYYLTGAPW